MSLRNLAIGIGLLAGCAGAAVKSELPGQQRGEVSVELRTASPGGAGWQSVLPGASLDSGTEFSIRVTASQPGFLYVGQRPAEGELTYLAQQRITPDQPAQLPDAGKWFQLDNHAGPESLYVLLSKTAQEPDAAKQLLGQRGADACAKTRDPPPPEVKHRDRGEAIHGLIGDDGLAILCFPFHHN